jgi:hypothetical protein
MAESKGRKSKKGQKQVILGVKEVLGVAAGLICIVMVSFTAGALAGRGDIYRFLHNWGLMGEADTNTFQPWNAPPVAFQPAESQNPSTAPLPTPHQGSITGAVAAAPPAVQPAPTPRPVSSAQNRKNTEEELRRMREELAQKLKFQNSLDSVPFRPAPRRQPQARAPEKPGATIMMRVVRYRDKKAAQARLAELRRQGEKVSLREGKDEEGPYFTVYRQVPAPPGPPSVAQHKSKSAGTKLKTKRD